MKIQPNPATPQPVKKPVEPKKPVASVQEFKHLSVKKGWCA